MSWRRHYLADHQLFKLLQSDYSVSSAIPVGRASFGLLAVLRTWCALGNSPLVALCANVCQDVVAAVFESGCSPIFLDVDPCTCQVPLAEWERAHQLGASVAIVVHLYGNPTPVEQLRQLFPSPNFLLIDDAAQALGATVNSNLVGSLGDVGLISFGPSKHVAVGGGVVLVKKTSFASLVEKQIGLLEPISQDEADSLADAFVKRFNSARLSLLLQGDDGASSFDGLLKDYGSILRCRLNFGSPEEIVKRLENYESECSLRRKKALAWSEGLDGSCLQQIGGGRDSVPWRYSCRIPGINWSQQHELGNAMRSLGADVSHWYLPTHWMCGYQPGSLPGVERVSQEIFQFWVDSSISIGQIKKLSSQFSRLLLNF